MKPTSAIKAARLAIAVVLVLSIATASEMAWRIYGLGLVIDAERSLPPLSAEAMSMKVAPLLRAASGADPIYSIVQTQHVDLHQRHRFAIEVAESARMTALIGLVCSVFSVLLLLYASYVTRRAKGELHDGLH